MAGVRRTLLVAFAASLVNMALLTVWEIGADRLVDVADWPLGGILFVWLFVFIVTAFGLTLLAALMSFVIPRRVQGIAAKLAFVLAGGILGWLMFGWTPEPMTLTAVMGALTGAFFALLSPAAFRLRGSPEVKAAA